MRVVYVECMNVQYVFLLVVWEHILVQFEFQYFQPRNNIRDPSYQKKPKGWCVKLRAIWAIEVEQVKISSKVKYLISSTTLPSECTVFDWPNQVPAPKSWKNVQTLMIKFPLCDFTINSVTLHAI